MSLDHQMLRIYAISAFYLALVFFAMGQKTYPEIGSR